MAVRPEVYLDSSGRLCERKEPWTQSGALGTVVLMARRTQGSWARPGGRRPGCVPAPPGRAPGRLPGRPSASQAWTFACRALEGRMRSHKPGSAGLHPEAAAALEPAPPPSLPGLSPPPLSNQTARFPGSDRVHVSAGPRPRLLRGHRRQPTGGAACSAGGAGSPDAGPRPRRARSGGARAVPLPEMSSAPSGVCGEKTWLLMTAVGVARDAPRPPRLRRTALSADSRFIVLTSP